MKRKILAVLLALVAAFTFTFAFTACDEANGNGGNSSSSGNSSGGGHKGDNEQNKPDKDDGKEESKPDGSKPDDGKEDGKEESKPDGSKPDGGKEDGKEEGKPDDGKEEGKEEWKPDEGNDPKPFETVYGSQGLEYGFRPGGYALTGLGTCTDTDIIVGNYNNGYRIVAIAEDALANCSNITSVTIPDGIEEIRDRAFANCSKLKNVTVTDSLYGAATNAFENSNGIENVTMPLFVLYCMPKSNISKAVIMRETAAVAGGTEIDGYVFSGCGNLANITLPDNVTKIAPNAFADTAYYKNARNWENGVLYIDNYLIKAKDTISGSYSIKQDTLTIAGEAFAYCENLTGITIPDSVENICYDAFIGCYGFESITMPSNAIKHVGAAESVVITSGTSIEDEAFFYCSVMRSITLPYGITSIGDYAFRLCKNLESINIPESVTSIGKGAFYECEKLESINIPEKVTEIGDYAFSKCSNLLNITVSNGNTVYHSSGDCLIETAAKTLIAGCKNSVIPGDGSVTSLGEYAFEGCSGLESLTIPNCVTSIGKGAFSYSDISNITIPVGVTSIADSAFNYCDSLESITVSDGNTVYHSNGNCLIATVTKTLIAGCKNSVIPDDGSVASIGYSAFNGLTGLKSIIIPDGVTEIGAGAFADCFRLESITISDSVTSIGYAAFSALTGYGFGFTIDFNGTREQWEKIEKDVSWTNQSYTLHCTDD